MWLTTRQAWHVLVASACARRGSGLRLRNAAHVSSTFRHASYELAVKAPFVWLSLLVTTTCVVARLKLSPWVYRRIHGISVR